MALDTIDGYLQSELSILAQAIAKWQAFIVDPTYDYTVILPEVQAAVTRCNAFVDFFRSSKLAQASLNPKS